MRILLPVLLIFAGSLLHGCTRTPRKPSADIIDAVSRKNHDPKEVQAFLNSDPTAIDMTNNYGERPLHLAAAGDRTQIVALLLEHGADVDAVGDDGRTALHYACDGGHTESAKQLIAANTKVGTVAEDGDTALHDLVKWHPGEIELLRLLLQAGADVSFKNNDGETPIDIVVRHKVIYTTPSRHRERDFDLKMIRGYEAAEKTMRQAAAQ